MAARIRTPSPVLESPATVLSQKRYKFATARVKSWAQVRFIVGKTVSIATHSASPRTRGPIVSVSRYDEGALDSELEAHESGVEKDGIPEVDRADWGVHLGRRMLLGSAVTAVALSKLGASGWARAEGNGTEDEKAKPITAGDVVEEGEKTRVYDASVLGEPAAVSGDRNQVWEKLLQARVVYLGESERVPDPGDRVLELGILRKLRDACFEQQRPVSLALDSFPAALQSSLDQYMSMRLSDAELQSMVSFWPEGLWEEYVPILQYCRMNGVRLMACGTPPEVLRKIQAKGIQGLSEKEKKIYVPPRGAGFGADSGRLVDQLTLAQVAPSLAIPYGPGPFQYVQARIVADYVMTEVVQKGMEHGGSVGLLIVITGASHVLYGSRGTGLPARVQKKLTKRTQAVVLLNPERQKIRKEGNVPEADFLWYSAARACDRNCFDRAEVARVMGAAGRRRDALPQDIQAGLERGLVDPEVLKSFFELDDHPIISALTARFQGLRERFLADPRFLQRLAIEESISITTTLLAQYQSRKERFWPEIEYVITDSVRGAVVDFFTVWLPAPTLSFRSNDSEVTGGMFEGFGDLLGSVPDNAFQRARVGESYGLKARLLAVFLGGLKLFGVGIVSSIGTLSVSNGIWNIRKAIKGDMSQKPSTKRSPMFKTAFVYGSFLGLSANLRYQGLGGAPGSPDCGSSFAGGLPNNEPGGRNLLVCCVASKSFKVALQKLCKAIAGIVEHWIADYFLASQPLAGSALSFAARIFNSYWGTGQWVDLARLTGLQASEDEGPPPSPVLEGQEAKVEVKVEVKVEDSLEAKTSAWEKPSVPQEDTDGAEVKQESEPTRAP